MKRFTFSRRGFLSVASAAGGSALLQSLTGRLQAHAAPGAMRKRIVFLTNDWGTAPSLFSSPAWTETNFPLRDMLLPFAPFQSKLTLINNMRCQAAGGGLHGNYGVFTGTDMLPPPGQSKGTAPQGVSIDQFLGEKIGVSDPFSTLVLNDSNGGGSFNSLGQAVSGFGDGAAAFQAIFSAQTGGGGSGTMPSQALLQKKNLLDFTASEITAFRSRLAGPEKLKLDQYLNGIERLQAQLAPMAPGQQPMPVQCNSLTAPSTVAPVGKQTAIDRAVYSTANCENMLSILGQALICGMTRVAFFKMNARPSALNRIFDANAQNVFAYHHHAQHGAAANPPQPETAPQLRQLQNTFWMNNIATLWKQLSAAPEGAGTVADSTLLVWMPNSGNHHGGSHNIPAIVLRDLGGTIRAGRHLRYAPDNDSKNPSTQSPNDFFTSLCNVMDVPLAKFGDPKLCSGPLPNFV